MERQVFERVVLEHKDRVYAYAVTMLRDPAEAQDVTQETMIRLWRHREGIDEQMARPWLTRTAHNLCIDGIRRRRARPEVGTELIEDAVPDPSPGPERLAEAGELALRIDHALGSLGADHRAVLVLREVQNLSYEEIAQALELPLGTLKARLHRARERLRERLARAGVTP